MRFYKRNGLFIPSYVKYNIEKQEKQALKSEKNTIKNYNLSLGERTTICNTVTDFLFKLIIVVILIAQIRNFGMWNSFKFFEQNSILFLTMGILFIIFLINDIITIIIFLIRKIYSIFN